MKAEDVIKMLRLAPHQAEGGYFVETHRSAHRHGDRALSTAIYYLLTPKTFSTMHRLKSEEVWHFYLGDPVEILLLRSGGGGDGEVVVLGADIAGSQRPQVVVPKGVWHGARLKGGGRHGFALLGTTMTPGFDAADFITARRAALTADFPAYAQMIRDLTKE